MPYFGGFKGEKEGSAIMKLGVDNRGRDVGSSSKVNHERDIDTIILIKTTPK